MAKIYFLLSRITGTCFLYCNIPVSTAVLRELLNVVEFNSSEVLFWKLKRERNYVSVSSSSPSELKMLTLTITHYTIIIPSVHTQI